LLRRLLKHEIDCLSVCTDSLIEIVGVLGKSVEIDEPEGHTRSGRCQKDPIRRWSICLCELFLGIAGHTDRIW
jgi:hypothetical protein